MQAKEHSALTLFDSTATRLDNHAGRPKICLPSSFGQRQGDAVLASMEYLSVMIGFAIPPRAHVRHCVDLRATVAGVLPLNQDGFELLAIGGVSNP